MKRLIAVVALLTAVAFAATPGDQKPAGYSGVIGVADTPVLIPFKSNQNAVALRNWINDGGTEGTAYCGFDSAVTRLTGFPLQAKETLSIDLAAQVANITHTNSDSLTDGGVAITAGAISPKLYCVTISAATQTDLHYIIVR